MPMSGLEPVDFTTLQMMSIGKLPICWRLDIVLLFNMSMMGMVGLGN